MTTPDPSPLKIGLVTDIHYADTAANEKRDTRASLHRVRQAIGDFQTHDVDVVVCLGDLIHSGPDVEAERSYMQTIVAELRRVDRPIYFCLGNHCVDRLTKAEALEIIGQPTATFEAIHKGIRILGLDTCFNPEGSSYGRLNSDWRVAVLPEAELDKLEQSISKNTSPTLLFSHHRLDANDDWSLRNAEEVRRRIGPHKHLSYAVQGHAHLADFRSIGHQGFLTLMPMVYSDPKLNAYSILTVMSSQSIALQGFGNQTSWNP
ncbi:metallophosphoesterase family protein [Algisphaera agarilytica]|uniref:Alkaline phosphatase n=1 Tax=Algisphaera agarilytica TaxID=1385975 RepID=A0A7X0HAY5_9BACT|nr:metallophosphoesterase [Algisphaera agarilytica]MBB6431376.1 alkaline phosphatase [Algisphaera agarilytica]